MDEQNNDPFGLDDFNYSEDFDSSGDSEFDFGDSDLKFDNADEIDKISVDKIEADFDSIDKGYGEEHGNSGDKKGIIKTSVIVIGIGLVIIIVAFSINRISSNKKSSLKDNKKNQSETVNNNVSTVNIKSNNWVQFSSDDIIEFETDITSSFTITDIKHYALITNNTNDKQLKSTLTGHISGLVGTYEMSIPFEMAQKLEIGTVFEVSYKIKKMSDYSVVSGIKY